MSLITRASLECYVNAMITMTNSASHRVIRNLTSSIKPVTPTAESKAMMEKMQINAAAEEKEHQLFLQGKLQYKPNTDTSADIYTKFGTMTSEERSAWIQNKLDAMVKAEAVVKEMDAKYERDKARLLGKAQISKVDVTA